MTMFKLAVVLLLFVLVSGIQGELNVGFYQDTCPNAESLVQQAVADAFATNPGVAPGLIRMHFHDCFVRGCDGSVLLDGNDTEKTSIPNLSLRSVAFDLIDDAKTAVEQECPGIVSCADILAFAARDSANLSGGVTWAVPAGRRDGNTSIASEALNNLPPPFFNSTQLVERFKEKNLTAEDMVLLSGAHTLGRSHCASFTSRLYENTSIPDSAAQTDPTLSVAYADLLRNLCPSNSNATDTITTLMDLITPNTLDNKYYLGVMNNLGLFTSDQALVKQDDLLAFVEEFSANATEWATKFGAAMVQMGSVDVLEGTNGEIRTNCRAVNDCGSRSSNCLKTRLAKLYGNYEDEENAGSSLLISLRTCL